MTTLSQLEACTGEIAAAAESLSNYCRNVDGHIDSAPANLPQGLVPPEAPSEARRARRSIIANAAKLQTLLDEPADLLQRLATQVCLSPPNPPAIRAMSDQLCLSRVAEPTPCLRAVVGRVPGAGLHTS